MTYVMEKIYSAGFSTYLHGYGAIDSWLGRKTSADIHVLTNASIPDLARLFDNLRYPGINLADAALDTKDTTIYFRCADSIDDNRYSINDSLDNGSTFINNNRLFINCSHTSFRLQEFYQDIKSHTFYDPGGIYPLLAGIRRNIHNPLEILSESLNSGFERTRALMDAALFLAKYFPPENAAERQVNKIAELFNGLRESAAPGQEEQRVLLSALMTSVNPGLGLELLKACGFVRDFWHELAILEKAEHSKEYHPEGNVWEHTMETFRYRKTPSRNNDISSCNLRLSLGLLLHDAGKPIAVSSGNHRFDGHAELGKIQAQKFLKRLGFSPAIINDVCFLVGNHMLTAALPRMPLFRTAEIMESDLFPLLLELYRCDESSSFKGLDGYYESSAAYQSYLRNRRKPYRAADGKKIKNRHHLVLKN
jgi:poly(A) polymerase